MPLSTQNSINELPSLVPYSLRDGFSFFIIKPDAVKRHLVGEILLILENRNFKIIELHSIWPTLSLVTHHYAEHTTKDYFIDIVPTLIDPDPCITGTVVHREMPNSTIFFLRELVGPYDNPPENSIRGHYALNSRYNSFHSSDSQSNAIRERKLWKPKTA